MSASAASPELKATVFCVMDQCLMACMPRTHPSACGAPSSRHPAKSVSTYTRGGTLSSCLLYTSPSPRD
eukprot:1790318-Alexandrium_andersonii.AAC.1